MDVAGKLVIVTGASQGIGAATSRELARRGAKAVLLARTAAKLDEVAHSIRAAGHVAHTYPCDLSDPAAVTAVAARITAELGTPDVIINNAGAGRWLAIDETPPEEAVTMMHAPYFAAFFITRAFIEAMIARGSGVIVNVQSPMSRVVAGGCLGYAACRWALRGFTEGLRADLRGTGIAVCEALLGEVGSDYWANNPGARERVPKIARWLLPDLDNDQAARAVARTIASERKLFMRPRMLGVLMVLLWAFPPIVRWLTVSTGWQRGR
ncbi:MAG TPA: SDR family oxidoreductase [Enhygromyxa sp.]|nr:SDR family oxidoreductase [Enhygromyxa sp.]